MTLLLVGFVLEHLRPYSYVLSDLNEGSATSYVANPRIHNPIGQLDIHGVPHLLISSRY